MRPEEIELLAPPLAATFGRSEAEHAAAVIIRGLAFHQLELFEPISWRQIQEAMVADVAELREPFASLVKNPFFRPDPHDLVERGFARWVEDGVVIELTPAVVVPLQRWWRR